MVFTGLQQNNIRRRGKFILSASLLSGISGLISGVENLHPLFIIGIFISFGAIIFGVLTIRCPICHRQLHLKDITPDDFCPFCGEKLHIPSGNGILIKENGFAGIWKMRYGIQKMQEGWFCFMFFIMGISNGEKKLAFDQLEICNCCGKYGHLEVYMTYMFFSFFFIPLFKWNRHYYVRMNCCNATTEISADLGKAIARGEVTKIPLDTLHFGRYENRMKHCSYCGFTTEEDFQYCPKCGRAL